MPGIRAANEKGMPKGGLGLCDLLLEIRDDGRGITAEEVSDPHSLGLIGIRERADLAGGTVHFEGVAGRGTIVSVRIPTRTAQT